MALTKVKNSNLDDADLVALAGNDGSALTGISVDVSSITGVTSTSAELNILDGVTSTSAELNILDGVTSTAAELNILDGVTSTAAELNILDGVTSTSAELNILDGVTSTAAELNILDGVTASTIELNYVDGVTALIQTQLDAKVDDTQILTNVPVSALFTDTVYTHPTGAGDKHIPSGGASGNVLTYSSSGTATWNAPAAGGASDIDGLSDGYTYGSSLALGSSALANTTNSAEYDVAIGQYALYEITSEDGNTAVGYRAGKSIKSSYNTAIGHEALGSNIDKTGGYNIAVGGSALYANTTGYKNTAIGFEALKDCTTGWGNSFVGWSAGKGVWTGSTGGGNTGMGYNVLNAVSSGWDNVAIGKSVMYLATTGYYNTGVGSAALQRITTGINNTMIGRGSGENITTGSNNVILGSYAGTSTLANTVAIYTGTTERLKIDSTGITVNGAAVGGGLYASVAIVEERGSPGSMTNGAWRVRDIDTEVSDSDGIVTVSSSQFTLQTGVYTLEWVTTGRGLQEWTSRCQNITDSSMAGQGMSTFSPSTSTESLRVSSTSSGVATVTLTAQKSFEIQAYSRITNSWGDGTGSYAAFYTAGVGALSTDIHTRVVIYKHA